MERREFSSILAAALTGCLNRRTFNESDGSGDTTIRTENGSEGQGDDTIHLDVTRFEPTRYCQENSLNHVNHNSLSPFQKMIVPEDVLEGHNISRGRISIDVETKDVSGIKRDEAAQSVVKDLSMREIASQLQALDDHDCIPVGTRVYDISVSIDVDCYKFATATLRPISSMESQSNIREYTDMPDSVQTEVRRAIEDKIYLKSPFYRCRFDLGNGTYYHPYEEEIPDLPGPEIPGSASDETESIIKSNTSISYNGTVYEPTLHPGKSPQQLEAELAVYPAVIDPDRLVTVSNTNKIVPFDSLPPWLQRKLGDTLPEGGTAISQEQRQELPTTDRKELSYMDLGGSREVLLLSRDGEWYELKVSP